MIHVAVLAGGQSRRMGRDKALLQLGDQTLIERVLAAAHPLGYPRLIIGDPAAYAHLGLPVHPDRHPGLGPLGGLYTALSTTDAPVLLLACDLPFLTSGLPSPPRQPARVASSSRATHEPQGYNHSARSTSRPA